MKNHYIDLVIKRTKSVKYINFHKVAHMIIGFAFPYILSK